jgi:hypothetical protein
MRKQLSKSWQGITGIVIGVVFYLVDCLVAHPRHPEVSWIKSGIYNWGPFGVLASAICVIVGVYMLLKRAD